MNCQEKERYSQVPPGPITQGPVLCLDIDGVLSPLGENVRYNIVYPPEGFVDLGWGAQQFHPDLPRWISELEAAYEQCVWISSRGYNGCRFAESAGLEGAMDWPYLYDAVAPSPVPDFKFRKLGYVAAWISSQVPVAMVDDHLAPSDIEDHEFGSGWGRDGEASIPGFYETREAPTLLIKPNMHVGMTRPIVDQLLRFAADPHDAEFDRAKVFKPDSDRRLAWPVHGRPEGAPGTFDEEERRKWLDEQERLERERYE